MKRFEWAVCLLGAVLLSGCAFQNKSITRFSSHQGYRLRNLQTNALNSDEVFVVLSFSGGGTRAAAFSYGAMEELAHTSIGHDAAKRRLLDEVDLISSVSGGRLSYFHAKEPGKDQSGSCLHGDPFHQAASPCCCGERFTLYDRHPVGSPGG